MILYLHAERITNMTEEWRDIPGYEGLYQASNLGRVKSLARNMVEFHKGTRYTRSYPERVLSQGNDGHGYKLCWLSRGGKGKSIRTHRLIALAFLPNPDGLRCINHKDENKSNNIVENLEWCTHLYNVNYGSANARRKAAHAARYAHKVRKNVKKHSVHKTHKLPNNDKAVYQMDMNGNILASFPSVKEATRVTGVNNISAAARGILRQSKGYKWMYVKDVSSLQI